MKRYYHGTRAVLSVGGLVLPPSSTGVRCSHDIGYLHHRKDAVYAVQDFYEGATYAMTELIPVDKSLPSRCVSRRVFAHPGFVYEIEPRELMGFDEDYDDWPVARDFAVLCDAAVIVTVHRVPEEFVMARLARHRWEMG